MPEGYDADDAGGMFLVAVDENGNIIAVPATVDKDGKLVFNADPDLTYRLVYDGSGTLGTLIDENGRIIDSEGNAITASDKCWLHYITLLALLLALIYEILRRKKLNGTRIAGAGLINFAIAVLVMIFGHCDWDYIFGVISIVATPAVGLILKRQKDKEEKQSGSYRTR